MLRLSKKLADRVLHWSKPAPHVNRSRGLLPMCLLLQMHRNDQNYWEQVEHYIAAPSEMVQSRYLPEL